jgi:hypothetical protein
MTSPCGLYEILLNRGAVVVETSSDTSEFAVDCLGLWLSEQKFEKYFAHFA